MARVDYENNMYRISNAWNNFKDSLSTRLTNSHTDSRRPTSHEVNLTLEERLSASEESSTIENMSDSARFPTEVDSRRKRKHLLVSRRKWFYRHWFLLFVYFTAVYTLVYQLNWTLPTPRTIRDDPRLFSEDRAMNFLETLASYGSRPVGSPALEETVINLFLNKLKSIKKGMKSSLSMDIDLRRHDSKYCTHSCFRNITNIAVRLGAKEGPKNRSLLLSCHTDSAPEGPGTSDDGAACSVYLEMLRVLSISSEPLDSDIIFLFNGAEETGLMGSKAFIQQHPWRYSVKAFINFEGAGAGGRELLFQAGPGNQWLMKAYLSSAPYPHCQITGQELFQGGWVPSGTDFAIYTQVGNISGLDLAFIQNGYVYHTEFDDIRYVTPGSLQRAGENLLETAKTIANSPQLGSSKRDSSSYVFFDLFYFAVSYPVALSTVLNILVCVCAFLKIGCNIFLYYRRGDKNRQYGVLDFFKSAGIQLLAIVFTVAVVLAMTRVVIGIGLRMFWYARPWMVLLLYILPGLTAGWIVHYFVGRKAHATKDPLATEQSTYDVTILICALLCVILTSKGIASAYIFMVMTLFPMLRDLLMLVIVKIRPNYDRSIICLLLCYIPCMFPVVLLGSYLVLTILSFFVPIMGRMGEVDSELYVGGISILAAVGIVLLTSSFVHVSRRMLHMILLLLFATGITLILTLISPLGEPYSFDLNAPRLKRVHVQHVSERKYDESNELIATNYVRISANDARGADDLPASVFPKGIGVPICNKATNTPCHLYDPKNTAFVTETLNLTKKLKVEVLNRTWIINKKRLQMDFAVSGAGSSYLAVYGRYPWSIIWWSVFDQVNQGSSVNVRLLDGNTNKPWIVTVVFGLVDGQAMNSSAPIAQVYTSTTAKYGEDRYSNTTRQIAKMITTNRNVSNNRRGWWKWAATLSPSCMQTENRWVWL